MKKGRFTLLDAYLYIMERICKACNISKPISEYGKHSKYKDKTNRVCKKCYNEYLKQYRERNPEKIKEAQSKYYKSNKRAILKHQREKYEADPEPKKQNMKKYHQQKKKANE